MAGIDSATNFVGGVMQSVAASQAAQAMGQEFKREMQRQQGFRNQAFDTFQTGLQGQGAEAATADVNKGATIRNALYNYVSGLGFGPSNSVMGGPTQMDLSQLGLRGQARANLGGYSDWALNRLVREVKTQNDLNKISNFAGGTAQVFPYKMYNAQHSWDELAFWGQLIQSLGGSGGWNTQSLYGAPGAATGGGGGGSMGGMGAATGGLAGADIGFGLM